MSFRSDSSSPASPSNKGPPKKLPKSQASLDSWLSATEQAPKRDSRMNKKVDAARRFPINDEDDDVAKEIEESYGGVPLSELNTTSSSLPRLVLESNHTILFKLPVESGSGLPPKPYPDTYRDAWDGQHVRLACSPQSLYPVEDASTATKKLKQRWDLIQSALLSNIQSSSDLQRAILSYNSRYRDRWNFAGLHHYFNEIADSVERRIFFQRTLPDIARLALRLPELIRHPVPLLKQQQDHCITMTQEQISCLLANAFFCTFPRRNSHKTASEYSTYPSINFNSLFEGGYRGASSVQMNKLSCMMNYFRRVTTKVPTGTITFHRRKLQDFPAWDRSVSKFTKLHVTHRGTIEDDGQGMLQMDFANKYVGGGVLSGGCVQEEIRFLICPELILSRLFTEQLADNECLIVTGVERYSDYEGYSSTFQWTGNHDDVTARDAWGRLCTQIVAIDALVFPSYLSQFRPGFIRRELNKAFCGFSSTRPAPILPAIATGNWGCGAFGGDLYLKALIQLMAAAQASRDVLYLTFGEKKLCQELSEFYSFLIKTQLTVGDIWACIRKYADDHLKTDPRSKTSIFKYIMSSFGYDESEDDEELTQKYRLSLDAAKT
ncbi:poly(ADP-ribose) glycohydrolase-like isoform X2 [Oscarella lobularis]|uniref:poly(ADP-ribose) glycohydrolase-like isoform X2 n=1 Tax=Oscarella lobularis TaxID=121494 RepID=UPI003313A9DF